jgi:hypothetical protein
MKSNNRLAKRSKGWSKSQGSLKSFFTQQGRWNSYACFRKSFSSIWLKTLAVQMMFHFNMHSLGSRRCFCFCSWRWVEERRVCEWGKKSKLNSSVALICAFVGVGKCCNSSADGVNALHGWSGNVWTSWHNWFGSIVWKTGVSGIGGEKLSLVLVGSGSYCAVWLSLVVFFGRKVSGTRKNEIRNDGPFLGNGGNSFRQFISRWTTLRRALLDVLSMVRMLRSSCDPGYKAHHRFTELVQKIHDPSDLLLWRSKFM